MGIKHIHKVMVHRDVRSANILIDMEGHAKLSDFGLAELVAPAPKTTDSWSLGVGTPAWMAPESMSSANHVFFKTSSSSRLRASDIYSFGVVLWEISTLKYPYEGMEKKEVLMSVKRGDRLPIPDECIFQNLIQQCWLPDPSQRPSAIQLLDALYLLPKQQLVKSLEVS